MKVNGAGGSVRIICICVLTMVFFSSISDAYSTNTANIILYNTSFSETTGGLTTESNITNMTDADWNTAARIRNPDIWLSDHKFEFLYNYSFINNDTIKEIVYRVKAHDMGGGILVEANPRIWNFTGGEFKSLLEFTDNLIEDININFTTQAAINDVVNQTIIKTQFFARVHGEGATIEFYEQYINLTYYYHSVVSPTTYTTALENGTTDSGLNISIFSNSPAKLGFLFSCLNGDICNTSFFNISFENNGVVNTSSIGTNYTTVNITAGSTLSPGTYYGNITVNRTDDGEAINISISAYVDVLAANIYITPNIWGPDSMLSNEIQYIPKGATVNFSISNSGNHDAEECNFSMSGSINAINSSVMASKNNFGVMVNTSNAFRVNITNPPPGTYSGIFRITCYNSTPIGGQDSADITISSFTVSSVAPSAPPSGGGGGGAREPDDLQIEASKSQLSFIFLTVPNEDIQTMLLTNTGGDKISAQFGTSPLLIPFFKDISVCDVDGFNCRRGLGLRLELKPGERKRLDVVIRADAGLTSTLQGDLSIVQGNVILKNIPISIGRFPFINDLAQPISNATPLSDKQATYLVPFLGLLFIFGGGARVVLLGL